MQPIPDTGPGLLGFIAHYLWRVYIHFPSPGKWDWVLLFLSLSLAIHIVVLPHIWKSVQSDMATFKAGKEKEELSQDWVGGYSLVMLFVTGIFFWSDPGLTFLRDRQLFGVTPETVSPRGAFWVSLCIFCVVFVVQFFLLALALQQTDATKARKSQPYLQRDFFSLYSGGGVVFKAGKSSPQASLSPTFFFTMFFLIAHIVYWYWAAGFLVLAHCFLFSVILTDGFRVLFVYILHKRTFGRTLEGMEERKAEVRVKQIEQVRSIDRRQQDLPFTPSQALPTPPPPPPPPPPPVKRR